MRLPDATQQPPLHRMSVARGTLLLDEAARAAWGAMPDQEAWIAVAKTAGVMAAKEANRLVPPMHPAQLTDAFLSITSEAGGVACTATLQAFARTGLESPAILAVTVALTTLWEALRSEGVADEGPSLDDVSIVQSVIHGA